MPMHGPRIQSIKAYTTWSMQQTQTQNINPLYLSALFHWQQLLSTMILSECHMNMHLTFRIVFFLAIALVSANNLSCDNSFLCLW